MANQRMVQTSLWRKSRRFKALQPLEKLLYLYLLTNSDTELCGAYELEMDEIALHTGIDYRTLPKTFERLEEVGLAKYVDGWVVIANYKAFSENPKVRKGIEDGMSMLPKEIREVMDSLSDSMDRLSYSMTDFDSDNDNDNDNDSPTGAVADEVIDYLNEKANKQFRHTQTNRNRILPRLKEGFTVEDCKAVIDRKSRDWLNNPDMSKYLRPETLFGSKFEGYLNEAITTSSLDRLLKGGTA